MTTVDHHNSRSDGEGPDRSGPSSRSRDVLVVAIVAIIALMLGVNLFLVIDDGQEGDLVGQRAPGFELPVFDSQETVSLEKYHGQVVVLDFWATWCPPCREQMPALEQLATDTALADEVAVVSINTDVDSDDRAGKVRQFLEEEELTIPTLIDSGEVQRAYRVATIPTLIIIDPGGQIVYESPGVHDLNTLEELAMEARDTGR